jgi:hypothetical protein
MEFFYDHIANSAPLGRALQAACLIKAPICREHHFVKAFTFNLSKCNIIMDDPLHSCGFEAIGV